MTRIAQNRENDQREISATLKKFYADYGAAGLLRACRGQKQKGISTFKIFQYLLSVDVTLTDRERNAIPARIVCVHNRNDASQPLVLAVGRLWVGLGMGSLRKNKKQNFFILPLAFSR